ncbi:uncharacterized protein HRG_01973 [Hirsutella rhossiliensis]|uniref:Dienelactone hydrolase domain-containing protein n=1 Tax=Hirsutella rhossiliensis TaxID=111463 RepID=A0A9P8N4B3_9HYPO|nr:uncharacterized protein HRG_01973 [Hirsutella rhossiliensis]KAH0966564.1 hypothetical protein HRG_01973 [Hirsutella rhossiliensis]
MSSAAPERGFFDARTFRLAAHLYKPAPGSPNRHGAAIVICHPWTSTKEQSPANYEGQPEGQPRHLEDPHRRVEDAKCAVTYLVGLGTPVGRDRVGALGICASGGCAPFALPDGPAPSRREKPRRQFPSASWRIAASTRSMRPAGSSSTHLH